MSQSLLNKNVTAIRQILDDYPTVHYAVILGSAVKNRLNSESDIDVAVATDPNLETDEKLRLMDALNTKLTHPVDLIDLNRVSGPILKQALCTGGRFKKKTSSIKLAELIKRMWYNQADMMPNSRMILKKHCKRFIDG